MAAGYRRWAGSALALVAIAWLGGPLSVACTGGTPAAIEPLEVVPVALGSYPLPNDLCLLCHSQTGLSAEPADGPDRELLAIEPSVFDASAHGWLRCVECHTAQSALPHPALS